MKNINSHVMKKGRDGLKSIPADNPRIQTKLLG